MQAKLKQSQLMKAMAQHKLEVHGVHKWTVLLAVVCQRMCILYVRMSH